MLTLDNISKSWGSFGHREIDLSVSAGEFFVLLGPSGAGKSLLLELVAGFHRPDSGRILIAGRDVTALPPEKRNVGLVHQEQMLFPHMTVRQNMTYGLKVRGIRGPAAADRIARLASMFRLEPLMERAATALSVGQQQRVALARALATEPDLLLLDEPFSSLDPPLRKHLWDELKDLHGLTGMTILHVTHDRDEARALGERIGIIREGSLQQVASGAGVFERPANRFVAEFTGGWNIYLGEARRNGAFCEFRSGSLELVAAGTLDGPCQAMVRPGNIIVSREPGSAYNRLAGTVESVSPRGDVYDVTAQFGDRRMTSMVTRRVAEELQLKAGASVHFSFDPGSVHLFNHDLAAEQSP